MAELHGVETYTHAGLRSLDHIVGVGLDGLVDDRLDPVPGCHRTWQFREGIPDQAKRQDEEREQEDHARELADGQVTGFHSDRPEQHERDVRERREHVGQGVEPAASRDRFDPRRSHPVGEHGEALGLAHLGAVRLHELHALEALVDSGRELAQLPLCSRVVRGHRPFVDDVCCDDEWEDDDRDDTEGDVGEEQPDGRHEDHQDRAGRERDRRDDADGGLGVNAGASHEVPVGMSTMPRNRLAHESIDDLIRVGLSDEPHPL